MWRASWRYLLQVRQTPNGPLWSPSAHLGLQTLRLETRHISPTTLHGCLLSSTLSTAAEAASIANPADSEANLSFSHAEVEPPPTHEYVTASAASATPLTSEEEQADSALTKIVEEHRKLVSLLRAELEEHKSLTTSILDEIRVLKLKADAETTEAKPSGGKRPWPEWNAFLEYLKYSDHIKDEKKANLLNGGSVFEDPACVKKAIHRFSQAHESIFEALSQIDLRILARYGCANSDPKATAAQKRLRRHFHMEDMFNEDIGEKSTMVLAKLSDVTRVLHSTIMEGASEEDVRSSISHLLREMITLSRKSETYSSSSSTSETTLPSSRPSASLSPSPLETIESTKQDKIVKEKAEVQKGDATTGDKRGSSSRAEKRTEAASRSQPQWKCPRCSFMNLDTKQRCVECSRRRPQPTNVTETPKVTNDFTVFDEDRDEDRLVSEKELKKTKEGRDNMMSAPSSRHESSKACSSVVATEELYDTDSSTDLEQSMGDNDDKDSKDKDPFDVLDDILDSEDSDNDSKEESRGSGKKTSLSSLFPPAPSAHSRGDKERNNSGRSERRRFNSKKYDDDEDHGRSRYASIGDDEDEDSLGDDEAPSHRGRDDGGYSRRSGGGGNNGLRERGGARGFRGDSLYERNNGGGPRSTKAFGDRARGGRSDSFGRRSSGGRSRY